ncbi:uncharacterized protein LOC113320566 [Papaver somniferum]|uniref:uncharacterized protein LOC113320566 n=1 Tax=Papaver somniferum TaxID=3469 RepID=UPI000E6F73DF|nr:uncharacterized protein LOC113320566 [Papaver somniferum]
MGSISYLVREKAEAYLYFLDLKRRYSELLNDVPSPSQNYHLTQSESLISFAKLRWESIYIPPLEEQFVPGVVNTEATKKEEVFIDELVPEFSQGLTPISLPDATSDSSFYSDSDEGLTWFLRSTSNIEDAVNSIVDFMVSPYEEIKSIPTGVDEEKESLELELIPSFFFVEREDDALIDAVSSQFTEIDKASLNDFDSNNRLNMGQVCFSILPDYTRLLFDRGKDLKLIKRFSYLAEIYEFGFDSITSCSFALYVCSILMTNDNDNCVHELVKKLGYQSAWPINESIMGMLVEVVLLVLKGCCLIQCMRVTLSI